MEKIETLKREISALYITEGLHNKGMFKNLILTGGHQVF